MWQCDSGICMTRNTKLKRWTGVGLYTALQAWAGSIDFTWSTTGGQWRVSSSKRCDLIYVQVIPAAMWRLVCRGQDWKHRAARRLLHSSMKKSRNRVSVEMERVPAKVRLTLESSGIAHRLARGQYVPEGLREEEKHITPRFNFTAFTSTLAILNLRCLSDMSVEMLKTPLAL